MKLRVEDVDLDVEELIDMAKAKGLQSFDVQVADVRICGTFSALAMANPSAQPRTSLADLEKAREAEEREELWASSGIRPLSPEELERRRKEREQ